MKKSVLVLSLVLSSAAFAQRGADSIGADAQRLASEVQREARYLTRDQAMKIQDKFQEIRGILYGTMQPRSDYTCVSRDNDNLAPWVYAIRDGINLTRIPSMAFKSIENCKGSIASIKYVAGSTVACVSKDNDDLRPWVFASITGLTGINKIAKTTTSSLAACKELMDRMLISNQTGSVTYCTSKDGDNLSPYVAINLNLSTGQFQQGSENFRDINACWSFLGQGKF